MIRGPAGLYEAELLAVGGKRMREKYERKK